MAQNVCLEKSSQSMFAKAVKNIKTLMKKNEEAKSEERDESNVPTVKAVLGRNQKTRRRNKRFLGRGVVYLRHIPKGFYEDEMREYFNQFGRVTRLNVVRSKATGNPKGYAFIEFLYSEVAQVVAETMNNYLMFGKILKAEYIPGDRVGSGMFAFSKIRPENCPRSNARNVWIEKTNRLLTDEEMSERAAREMKKLGKIKKKMEESGIKFDCQVDGDASMLDEVGAVDIPELDEIKPKEENSVNSKLLKKKNQKRSLSASFKSGTRVKKRMKLIEGLKSKKTSSVQSPTESPVLRPKRMNISSTVIKQKRNKS